VRKRRKIRTGPPAWLFACVAACVTVVALFPVAHQLGWFRPARGPAPSPAPAKPGPPAPDPALQAPVDLALSEVQVRFDGPARYLEGQVRNSSASRYENVEVLLSIRSRSGAILGTVTGRIDAIAPKSAAAFRTGALPDGAFRHTLRDITGTRK
jgi:hypothetical protein